MLPALPQLVADKDMQAVCLAVLLAGLDEPERARQILADINLPEAESLRNYFT
jgi:type III secretion system SsaH family protein